MEWGGYETQFAETSILNATSGTDAYIRVKIIKKSLGPTYLFCLLERSSFPYLYELSHRHIRRFCGIKCKTRFLINVSYTQRAERVELEIIVI